MRCVEVTVWRSWTRISTTTPLTTCLNENLTASCSSLTALQVRPRRATTDNYSRYVFASFNSNTVTETERYLYCGPHTGRLAAHYKTSQMSMFPGVRTYTETKMFSVLCEMSLSTAAASYLSAPCSMHVVQQQRKLCLRFLDTIAVWRGCHTMRYAMQM